MTTTARGRVKVQPGSKRIRTYLGGGLAADTFHPLLVWEVPYYPTYYFPLADVHAELLPTGEVDHSPSRGDAERFDVRVGDVTAPGAGHIVVASPIEGLRGHVRLEWGAMDSWFEEDEEVHVHARDPYTRIDILASSRRVVVRVGDLVLADSTHAHALFETGLPTRWYLPKVDVRMDLLVPSPTLTQCPYKGQASYYSLRAGDIAIDDVAWYYPTPLPESQKIAGMVSFFADRVTVEVEGE
ncbi:MAG TPA: DUF427 domain-containing protein [Acidimicrobiales bacterium]